MRHAQPFGEIAGELLGRSAPSLSRAEAEELLTKARAAAKPVVVIKLGRTELEGPVATLRDLMDIKPAGPPVPLDEVEPVEDILMRFDSAGMSLGALSPEAHEALAIAMNRKKRAQYEFRAAVPSGDFARYKR